jgi:hypothetical protein
MSCPTALISDPSPGAGRGVADVWNATRRTVGRRRWGRCICIVYVVVGSLRLIDWVGCLSDQLEVGDGGGSVGGFLYGLVFSFHLFRRVGFDVGHPEERAWVHWRHVCVCGDVVWMDVCVSSYLDDGLR